MIRKTNLSSVVTSLTSMICAAALGAVALGASGCSKSLPKLTDDQKAQLSGTIQSAGRGPTAASDIGGGAFRNTTNRLPLAASWLADMVSSHSTGHDDTELSMETKLKTAHDSHACDITAKLPDMSNGTVDISNINVTLKVTGNTCPLSMDFEVSVQSAQSSLAGKISGQYSVTDKDFAALNDVNSISLDGTFGASSSQNGSGELDLNLTGSLVSQKYGNVSFTLTASGSGNNTSGQAEIVADFVFPTFEAKLKEEIDGSKTTYSINGEDVSAEEFNNYFNQLGVSAVPTAPATGGTRF